MPRPIGPLTTPSQELRHFTNREHERDALRRLLDLPAGQPLPVLMFFGVGGTGKTWLLRKLRADLPPALLDFEPLSGGTPYHTDQSRALAELRRQLPAVEGPRFDLASSWLRFMEGVTDEPLLKGKGLVGTATEALVDLAAGAAEGLPLVGAFVKTVVARLGQAFKGSAGALVRGEDESRRVPPAPPRRRGSEPTGALSSKKAGFPVVRTNRPFSGIVRDCRLSSTGLALRPHPGGRGQWSCPGQTAGRLRYGHRQPPFSTLQVSVISSFAFVRHPAPGARQGDASLPPLSRARRRARPRSLPCPPRRKRSP